MRASAWRRCHECGREPGRSARTAPAGKRELAAAGATETRGSGIPGLVAFQSHSDSTQPQQPVSDRHGPDAATNPEAPFPFRRRASAGSARLVSLVQRGLYRADWRRCAGAASAPSFAAARANARSMALIVQHSPLSPRVWWMLPCARCCDARRTRMTIRRRSYLAMCWRLVMHDERGRPEHPKRGQTAKWVPHNGRQNLRVLRAPQALISRPTSRARSALEHTHVQQRLHA